MLVIYLLYKNKQIMIAKKLYKVDFLIDVNVGGVHKAVQTSIHTLGESADDARKHLAETVDIRLATVYGASEVDLKSLTK